MSNKITFELKVSQKNIDEGEPGPTNCALTRAIREAFPNCEVTVGASNIHLTQPDGMYYTFLLTTDMLKFIKAFDNGAGVIPTDFGIITLSQQGF